MEDRKLALERIDYRTLNARQKENYNFLKVSAVLADFGFVTFRLTDDWLGADFIALHISGSVLRVQLKGRLTFQKALRGKGLYVAFFDRVSNEWYLYDHDKLLTEVLKKTNIGNTKAWKDGLYHIDPISQAMKARLEKYRIPLADAPITAPTDAVDQSE